MRTRTSPVVFVILTATLASLAADRAPNRPLTDPGSIESPANRASSPVPVEDLFFSRRVQGPSWSPDGLQIVFTTNLTGRFNLWKVSAEGGWPLQLAQSDDRQVGATWSPDGKWIAYLQDSGGNEQFQIYLIPSEGGKAINLTDDPETRFTSLRFSRDGRYLAFGMKQKTSPATDVAVMELATRSIRNLTQEKTLDHWWNVADWSPDGTAIYATRRDTAFSDYSIYRVDVRSASVQELTPHTGPSLNIADAVSPDGRTLLITSNQKAGHSNVALLDIASKKVRWITDSEWEASGAYFSPDNEHFTYVINRDGRSEVYVADRSGAAHKIAFEEGLTSPDGAPNAYSPKGDKLLLVHQGATRPSDLWVYHLSTQKALQLSRSAIASLDPNVLPTSQIVHYASFDGKVISAILWMPPNLKRDGTNPAVVIVHGGPTDQMLDAFNATAAALASRGYVCIAPNVRGSTGYGIDFQRANYQDFGGGDLQDEVHATKFLVATGFVDPKKIGITGGSYGGFMTLMALGKTPDVWAAGAENYGVVDWGSMLKHADAFIKSYVRSLLGDETKNPEVYEATSTLKYLPHAKAPLLILHGENDVRVPKEEAEQVVSLYKQNGKTVEVKFYPQEGHSYAKRENQVDALQRVIGWFDRYLKGLRAAKP